MEDLEPVTENLPAPQSFRHIELEPLDVDLFRATPDVLWKPPVTGARGVFGGQMIGQSLAAAAKSVPSEMQLHSMHSYFLQKGSMDDAIIYNVNALRDGTSYATRLVTGVQRGKTIFVLTASFAMPEASKLDRQALMPMVPSPDELPTEKERWEFVAKHPRCPQPLRDMARELAQQDSPLDFRRIVPISIFDETPAELPRYEVTRQLMWIRAKQRLADDPNVHAAVVAYMSDLGLLSTARGRVSLRDVAMVASLDHSMWFHAKFRADEWLLYEMESPRAGGGRGLAFGRIFTQDGTLAVTVAQEGVMRLSADFELTLPPLRSKL